MAREGAMEIRRREQKAEDKRDRHTFFSSREIVVRIVQHDVVLT
jgi:hypothetical protein